MPTAVPHDGTETDQEPLPSPEPLPPLDGSDSRVEQHQAMQVARQAQGVAQRLRRAAEAVEAFGSQIEHKFEDVPSEDPFDAIYGYLVGRIQHEVLSEVANLNLGALTQPASIADMYRKARTATP